MLLEEPFAMLSGETRKNVGVQFEPTRRVSETSAPGQRTGPAAAETIRCVHGIRPVPLWKGPNPISGPSAGKLLLEIEEGSFREAIRMHDLLAMLEKATVMAERATQPRPFHELPWTAAVWRYLLCSRHFACTGENITPLI